MSNAAQPKIKKTAATTKKPLSHPTFAVMIVEAITSLKERTGSSQYAITKFIEGKHKELPPTYKKLVLIQLKKSVAAGILVKVKNSFKLAPTKPVSAPAKTVVAAPKKPKSVTKTTTKAASKPNKPVPKKKPVSKPKAKTAAAAAKPKAKPAKKVVAKSAKKTPVKAVKKPKSVVKKPKSVKSPAKKTKK